MSLSKSDTDHVFQRLRDGLVPERGLDAFAVGIERQRAEMRRLLELAEDRRGRFKFLRGGYGCGKTFMARLAVLDAQARGFATSFVVVSDNDLHFHRFDDVYRKVVQELGDRRRARAARSATSSTAGSAEVEDGAGRAAAPTRRRPTSTTGCSSASTRSSPR